MMVRMVTTYVRWRGADVFVYGPNGTELLQ